MEKFKKRFTRKRNFFGIIFAILSQIPGCIRWIAEQFLGEWTMNKLTPFIVGLPKLLSGLWQFAENKQVIFGIIIVFAFLVIIFAYDLFSEYKKPSWKNIEIVKWNKTLIQTIVSGGLKIENITNKNIEKCCAEIIEIYDENGLGLYGVRQAELPRTAGWEKDGELFFSKYDINHGKTGNLALIFSKSIFDTVSIFYIGGKNNFQGRFSKSIRSGYKTARFI